MQSIAIMSTDTENLETELRQLSERMSVDPIRFQQVSDELKRRRDVARSGGPDDQPVPRELTPEQLVQEQLDNARQQVEVLTLKVISMETEQAKLVVEVEIAKAATKEAQDRLALVAKNIKLQQQS